MLLSFWEFFTNQETSTRMCRIYNLWLFSIENQRVKIDLLLGPLFFKVLFEGPVIFSQADVKRHDCYIHCWLVCCSCESKPQPITSEVWSIDSTIGRREQFHEERRRKREWMNWYILFKIKTLTLINIRTLTLTSNSPNIERSESNNLSHAYASRYGWILIRVSKESYGLS